MRKPRAPRLPRVPFGRTVAVVPDDESGEAFELQSANLSLGGMFMRADCMLPEGTRVTLALAVENRYLDFAEGEVAWTQSRGGFGVRFTHLPPKALALVEHLVARGGTSQFMKFDPEELNGDDEAYDAQSDDAEAFDGQSDYEQNADAQDGQSHDAQSHHAQAQSQSHHAQSHAATQPRRGVPPVLAAVSGAAVAAALVCAAFFGARKLSKPPAHTDEPARLVAMSLPPEPAIEHKLDPAAHVFPGEFQVALPTGGVTGLRITVSDDEVAVTPSLKKGATILRVFSLPHPARLVIDVAGREPRYSWQLDGANVVKSVRVGARNHGTRVVVDLPELANPRATYRVITAPPVPFI